MRLFDSLLFLVAGAIIGVLAYAFWFNRDAPKDPLPAQKQEIMLEKIKQVAKLITVEGEFANVHEYEDYLYDYKLSVFQKKALIRVKARVSVGYDLKKMTWEVDSTNRIIRVRDLPDPEILSIDHDLEYYDIQEGMFHGFKEEDYNLINKVVKKRLRDAVQEGPLMDKARNEGISNLEIIQLLVEQAGWTFEVVNGDIGPGGNPLDSLKNIKIPDPERKVDSLLN
jgi:hypothetical protein